MKEGISVIIPVYQVERYLERCLDSVLAQTLLPAEIILVDDGSTDRGGEICDAYAAKDARIQVIHQQNAGLGLARNSGLTAAQGEYVAFLDSDDYVRPDLYERLYHEAKRLGLDFVGSGECIVKAGGQVEKRAYVERVMLFETEEVRALLLGSIGAPPDCKNDAQYGMSVWKNLYRKEIIDRHGICFLSERQFISEDILFNMDFLIQARCAAMLPDCLYCYCVNGESLSKSYRPDRFKQDKALYREIARKLAAWGLWQTGRLYAARLLISRGRYNAVREVAAVKEGLPPLCERVRNICQDALFREVLGGYPVLRLPPMQAFFALLMKWRWVLPQIVLVKLRYRRKTE